MDSIFLSIRVNLDEFWSNAKSRKPTNYEDPNNDGSTDHKRKRRYREREIAEKETKSLRVIQHRQRNGQYIPLSRNSNSDHKS